MTGEDPWKNVSPYSLVTKIVRLCTNIHLRDHEIWIVPSREELPRLCGAVFHGKICYGILGNRGGESVGDDVVMVVLVIVALMLVVLVVLCGWRYRHIELLLDYRERAKRENINNRKPKPKTLTHQTSRNLSPILHPLPKRGGPIPNDG